MTKQLSAGHAVYAKLASIAVASVMSLVPFAASAATIYDSIPSGPPLSSPSVGFQATQTNALGDYVAFAGTDRTLTNVDVLLNSWACQTGAWNTGNCANPDTSSTGFDHPITLTIYNVDANGVVGSEITHVTQTVHVPWRPATDPACTGGGHTPPTCSNGFNFVTSFAIPNVVVPDKVAYAVSYNTQTYGTSPIEADGPYNSLNVGVPNVVPSVGTDTDADAILWNTTNAANYTDGGAGGTGTLRKDTNWTGNVPAARFTAITPEVAPPASCPVGTTATLVDTKTVDSTQVAPVMTTSLTNGQQYLMVASGSWTNSSLNVADAEYASTDAWATQMDGYNINPYFLGAGEFDLQVDNAFVNWGAYSPTHSYSYLYTGTGAPAALGIFDGDSTPVSPTPNAGWYGDNSGSLSVNVYKCVAPPQDGAIHIYKYVNGVMATAGSVAGVSFPMITPTYGNAPFTLGVGGWTVGDVDYEASTGTLTAGSTYTAYENTSTALVGASCDGVHPYALVGYSLGSSLSEAEEAPVVTSAPTLTVAGDQYLIVHNQTCVVTPPIKVHIVKYLDGALATAVSAAGYQFPMTATWSALNIGAGTGAYVLGNSHGGAADVYGADTAAMSVPADYTTSEITSGDSMVLPIGATCAAGKYRLLGYQSSAVSFADALTQPLVATAPVFAGLTSDRYVVVKNETCPLLGTISGMKYNDLNRNGKKDANEPGLAGWTIRLKQGNTIVATVVTGAGGTYTFPNLAPGTYKLREVHQNGWKRMSKNPKPVVIVAGSAVTGIDFGNAQKRKEEKEDNDNDDNRDDQQGQYTSHRGSNDYRQDR